MGPFLGFHVSFREGSFHFVFHYPYIIPLYYTLILFPNINHTAGCPGVHANRAPHVSEGVCPQGAKTLGFRDFGFRVWSLGGSPLALLGGWGLEFEGKNGPTN